MRWRRCDSSARRRMNCSRNSRMKYSDTPVKHPEYDEPYTFEKWLNIYSAHIPGHIEQIKNNYKIWRDQQG